MEILTRNQPIGNGRTASGAAMPAAAVENQAQGGHQASGAGASGAGLLNHPWSIQMLGSLQARRGNHVITRFRSQTAGLALARLAYYLDQSHSREELADSLWPESDRESCQRNLRVTVNSLRHQLEPPGVPTGSILESDRSHLRLNPAAVTTDTADFMQAVSDAEAAAGTPHGRHLLENAVRLYTGTFLPGYYDDWVLAERQILADAYLRTLCRLTRALEESGELDYAIEHARLAVGANLLQEETHYELIRLFIAAGRPEEALLQYRDLEAVLRRELGQKPSLKTRSLLGRLIEHLKEPPAPPTPPARAGARGFAGSTADRAAPIAPPESQTRRQQSAAQSADPHPPRSQSAKTSAEVAPAATTGAGSDSPAAASPSGQRRVTPLSRSLGGMPVPIAPSPRPVPSLPLQLTPFFGREEELDRLSRMLDHPETRLITLTGPGGAGKTRLSIELAAQRAAADSTPCFVPLADLSDAGHIPDAIARALELNLTGRDLSNGEFAGDGDRLDQVAAMLASQPTLLVLDTFEHLAEEGAAVVRGLLERTHDLICLVTSRQALDLAAEQEFPVAPLPTPPGPDTPERLMRFASVQLFVDRAQRVSPDFQVTARNAAAVAGLCGRLDGIPLALELAAGWIGTLAPAQMLSRLSQRFSLLVSRKKDYHSRHRTLRAALDWSYGLLEPELRRFFGRLSVFRGGWTLETAEVVCAAIPRADGRQTADDSAAAPALSYNLHPLDALAQLRSRSLVNTHETETHMRYSLLDTLREYAGEQLDQEERTRLERRHAEHFLELAEAAEPEIQGPGQADYLSHLEEEHENLQAALEWSRTSDPLMALRLAGALWRFWYVRGYLREGRLWLQKALDAAASLPEVAASTPEVQSARAKALNGAGILAWAGGDDAAARSFFDEGLDICRQAGNRRGVAIALSNLGLLAQNQHDFEGAGAIYRMALAICKETGYTAGAAGNLMNLGVTATNQRDFSSARSYLDQSLALYRKLGDRLSVAIALHNLGEVARQQGSHTSARSLFEDSLAVWWSLGNRNSIVRALNSLGAVALSEQDHERAAWLFGAAEAERESTGASLPPLEWDEYQKNLAAVQLKMGEALLSQVWEQAKSTPLDQVVAYALGQTAG